MIVKCHWLVSGTQVGCIMQKKMSINIFEPFYKSPSGFDGLIWHANEDFLSYFFGIKACLKALP